MPGRNQPTPALVAPDRAPTVVSLHRPDSVSGVSSVGARLARLGAHGRSWIPLVIGPRSRSHAGSPLRSCPGFSRVEWPDDADPIEQCLLVQSRLRELGAQVVVANDLPQGYVAAALDQHRGTRLAAWVHGDDHDWDELMLRAGPLLHTWAGVNSRIVHRTQAVAPRLGPAFGVLTGCVDVRDAPSPLDSNENTVPAPFRLVYTGRLEKKHKRVLDLANLADTLHAMGVDFVLTIAGAGPAETELAERLWPHVLQGRANLLGPIPLDTIPRLVRANHMLILTSQCEGAPTSVMEALAQGRPVAISSGCGVAFELVHDGVEGIVFPIGAIEGLAKKIAGVATDRAWLARAGVAAHVLARQHFATAVVGARADAFVRAAIEAPSSPSGLSGAARTHELWDSAVRTMQLLGPTPSGSLASLAERWLKDRRESGVSLPVDVEELPTREARMLLGVIARLSADGMQRVALYGAGWHTRKLAATLQTLPGVVAIVDDRAGGEHGLPTHLASKPIVTPSQAKTLGLDAIVISSDEHEREMLERAKAWAKGARIVPIYLAA